MLTLLSACSSSEANESTESSESVKTKEIETENDESNVITINDHDFSFGDLDFYKLMNEIKVDLQAADMEEADKGEIEAYLEEQLGYYENVNVNLQSLIELYAMTLLAEEKNYFVPDEKLEKKITEFKKVVEGNESASERVNEFGEQAFNRNIQEYIRQSTLRDRIASDLKEEIVEENEDATEHEINYLLEERFDDLYNGQLGTLELDIHIK